ncbi:MAG: alpha-1,2-fucosyltransferase, partial [Armatimonadetes bacterium]|nr:alpha-1,2-fucosyltransferase [Akkermansiaceae bacterium]
VETMRCNIAKPRFFIFSDDPDWCRRTFTDDDMEVIDSGEKSTDPLYDLLLMSHAAHHIIANSSYSWWGAWLGDKPEQRVIMPDRWYRGDTVAPMSEKRWKA